MRTRIVLSKFVQFCFLLTGVTLLCAADGGGVRYDVKADRRTGQLIRRAVPVTPRVVAPVLVSPDAPLAAEPKANPAESRIHQIVETAANHYKVDPLLVHAVIAVESNYNPYAVSPVGAQGLMQLMPETAAAFGVRNRFDAAENIRGGVAYLAFLLDRFDGDLRLVVAAYNAGHGRIGRAGLSYGNPETVSYARRVAHLYHQYRRDLRK